MSKDIGMVDERAAFEVCGVTVRRNEVGDWEYLSEGYGNDPDSWVACSDILGPFGGSGVDALLTAYAELQARDALSAPSHGEQAEEIARLRELLTAWRRMFDGGIASGELGVLRGQTDAALAKP